jgi:hypothetical protein
MSTRGSIVPDEAGRDVYAAADARGRG